MDRQRKQQPAGQTCTFYFATQTCGASFVDAACFEFYLQRLFARARPYRIMLHAYVILPSEVMIIATPGTPWAMTALLHSLDKSYCEYFNLRFRRYLQSNMGKLQSGQILDDESLLECQRFLETEPCRQLGLEHPGEYHWSSYNRNAFYSDDEYLCRHAAVNKLREPVSSAGPFTASGTVECYRNFLGEEVPTARNRYLAVSIRHGFSQSRSYRNKPSLRSDHH